MLVECRSDVTWLVESITVFWTPKAALQPSRTPQRQEQGSANDWYGHLWPSA